MPGQSDDTQQKRWGQCLAHVRRSIRVCSLLFLSDDNDKQLRSGPVPSACFLPCEMGWVLKIQDGIRRLRLGVKTFGKSGGREYQNSLCFYCNFPVSLKLCQNKVKQGLVLSPSRHDECAACHLKHSSTTQVPTQVPDCVRWCWEAWRLPNKKNNRGPQPESRSFPSTFSVQAQLTLHHNPLTCPEAYPSRIKN